MKRRIYNQNRAITESVPDRECSRCMKAESHRRHCSSLETWCAEASWKSLKNQYVLPPIIQSHMSKVVWIYGVQCEMLKSDVEK